MSKLVFIFFLISAPVHAQTMEAPMAPPAPAMTASVVATMAPAPAMAAPIPAMAAPVVAPMAVAPVAPPVAPATATPMVSEDPGTPETVVSAKAVDATATMSAAPAPASSAPAKAPTNWAAIITAIGMAITALLALLGSLGLLKWTKNARVQLILKLTKKGTEAFLAYAENTPAAWDDALAKILDNTNAVLIASGETTLSTDEKETVTKLANSFKNVANSGK